MEPINKEKKEQHTGKYLTLKVGRQNIPLITQKVKIIPKSVISAENILKKHAHQNKIFRIYLPLSLPKQLTSKSTNTWSKRGLTKYGLQTTSVTGNCKQTINSRIWKSEINVPTFSDKINSSRIDTEFDFFKNRIQTQKPNKRHLMKREAVHYPKSDSELGQKKDSLKNRAEQSSYFYLDSSLKDFLTGILNIRIPSVKIYANQTSDALTKQFDADALTYNNNIFFKAGKYDPRDRKGVALLGHELTHTAQLKLQDKSSAGSSLTNYSIDEQEAIDNEKRVLHYFPSVDPYSMNKKILNKNIGGTSFREYRHKSEIDSYFKSPTNPPSFLGNVTNTNKSFTQIPATRTALTSRDLSLPSESNVNSNSAFQVSEQQFRSIKDEIYRDIMNRIRIEFERGG